MYQATSRDEEPKSWRETCLRTQSSRWDMWDLNLALGPELSVTGKSQLHLTLQKRTLFHGLWAAHRTSGTAGEVGMRIKRQKRPPKLHHRAAPQRSPPCLPPPQTTAQAICWHDEPFAHFWHEQPTKSLSCSFFTLYKSNWLCHTLLPMLFHLPLRQKIVLIST